MNTEAIDKFVQYIKSKAYNLSKNAHVTYNVFFEKNGIKKTIYKAQSRFILSRLKDDISLLNPDIVKVEIMHDDRKETHELEINKGLGNIEHPSKEKLQPEPFNFWDAAPLGTTDTTTMASQQVQALVKEQLEKERKNLKIAELQAKLQEKIKLIEQKETEIEKLLSEQATKANGFKSEIKEKQKEIEDKLQEIERLEKVLKDKKNFKYYAGLTGDILQSFGIKKETIAKPLAGLLSGNDEDVEALEQSTSGDASGIVDDEPDEASPSKSRRQEMIDLLTMYLENIDTLTMEKLFAIFSEIESDNTKADQILIYLNQLKQQQEESQ